ncbi:MAG: FKBP-type peptidyl-prolyl cis-trans isomerase [Planctomycetota bacterium]
MIHSRLLTSVIVTGCLMFVAPVVGQQEGQQDPELQLKPSAVVQKPNAKTLVEKISFLIGFNFMDSAKEQPDVNLDEIFKGMQAAKNGENKSSFIAGYQMMKRIQANGAELQLDQVRKGMEAASADKERGMSDEEVQMLTTSFAKMLEEKRIAELKKESEDNLAAGFAYIEGQKKQNPKLKELENGCYYEVIKEGTGAIPTEDDRVRIDYTGRFINGKVFDSSVAPPSGAPPQPAEFNVKGVVPGFSKTIMSMKTGAKWRVIIPGPMAYGVRGNSAIGPNETLIFEIELLKILGEDDK